jgi:hypothetical protein
MRLAEKMDWKGLISAIVYRAINVPSANCFTLLRKLQDGAYSPTKVCFLFWRNSPQWARASSFTWFLDHIRRRTTVRRTPLDE